MRSFVAFLRPLDIRTISLIADRTDTCDHWLEGRFQEPRSNLAVSEGETSLQCAATGEQGEQGEAILRADLDKR
jgi:hypothetical protein